MTFLLIFCTNCRTNFIYEFRQAKRPRKTCSICNRKFAIGPVNIIKTFDDSRDALHAIKILKQYLNDQAPKGTLKNVLQKFKKMLKEHVLTAEQDFINNYGHEATPKDQLTLADLKAYSTEIDRVHFSFVLQDIFYKMNFPAFQEYRTTFDFGSIVIYPSGVIDFYLDSSEALHLAQAEGVLNYFINVVGHKGPLKIKLHDHELTLTIPYQSILADKIEKLLGEKTRVAFIEQSVKIYNRKNEHWRIEAGSIGDVMNVVNQIYSGKIGQQGINVVAIGPDNQKSLMEISQKIETQLTATDKLTHNLIELDYLTQDMKQQNELGFEGLRGQLNNIESGIDQEASLYISPFERKLKIILDLSKPGITLSELAQSLDQTKQGIKRYLDYLEETGKIKRTKLKSGKRGKPQQFLKVIQ